MKTSAIESVLVNAIRVLNPRSRNRRVFAEIVDSISSVGLKKPITVARSPKSDRNDELEFNLVCGQGRLEAFKLLNEETIPAIVVEASEIDCYLMSLIENIARRKHTAEEVLGAIRVLEDRGYSAQDIADKTGLDPSYVNGIMFLLKNGEDRLIGAVEKGWLPIALARDISKLNDSDLQLAMMQAYEDGVLRGDQLMRVRRLIDRRRGLGKSYSNWSDKSDRKRTAQKLLQTYQNEAKRQQLAIKKAEVSEQRLLFVTTAMRKLLSDEHFRTILRAERIEDLPAPLAERLSTESR